HGNRDSVRRRLRQPHPLRRAAAGERPADDPGRREDRYFRRQGQRRVRREPYPDRDRGAAPDPPPRQVGAPPALRRLSAAARRRYDGRMGEQDDIRRVTGFWREAGYAKWFNGGAAFDAQCRAELGELHMAAARRECDNWMDSPEGAAALLILLDQIPRNIFRGSGHAFATDPLALLHARHAVDTGLDREVAQDLRAFVYMPFEHSEGLEDQHRAVALFEALGN